MSDTSTLLMPAHAVDGDPRFECRATWKAGYALEFPDGRLHCNRCGWVTPEPVVTTYSPDTDKVYLTWDAYVAAETNGYVVISTSSRPNTAPAVYGPYPTAHDAEKARQRLRRKMARDEAPHTVSTSVRLLGREYPS